MIKSNKGQVSRTMLLFSIGLFYIGLFVFYSVYGNSIATYTDNSITSNQDNFSFFDDFDDNETDKDAKITVRTFFRGVGTTFNETPWWLNLLLFVPLSILLIYLLIVAWFNPGG